jgi:hypothetical protein
VWVSSSSGGAVSVKRRMEQLAVSVTDLKLRYTILILLAERAMSKSIDPSSMDPLSYPTLFVDTGKLFDRV